MAAGSWTLTEELFSRGDASFVLELRSIHDPERLGTFAATWIADKRPFARQAILEYLALPLNCYRHEPLVKRLFKLAEAAKDDEVMGAFLVAFDRTIRRARKKIRRTKFEYFPNREAAEVAAAAWEKLGFKDSTINPSGNQVYLYASKQVEALRSPNNRMPSPGEKHKHKAQKLNDWQRQRIEKKFLLFSRMTRRYLRRRAWRYFRAIGKADPLRYVQAAAKLLVHYRDEDVDSDIHLLDNWGLTHALFYNCPALSRTAKGCELLPGKKLSDLTFAPLLEPAWSLNPDPILNLLLEANCRTVLMFSVWLLQTKCGDWLRKLPVSILLKLADHADPEVSAMGFELLESSTDLSSVPVEEWLRRLDGDDLDKLTRLSDFLCTHLDPAQVTLANSISLAAYRSRPVAALGFTLLKAKSVTPSDVPALLTLTQAECESVRPEMTIWLREKMAALAGPVESSWVLDFLDSKHADVRRVGWNWLHGSILETDTGLWHKLMESPYQDIRNWLSEMLTKILNATDTDTLRFLWATVLCSIHCGSRQKTGIVGQIVTRISKDTSDAPKLLPLLAVAVRSLRGPEFRAGLTGVVMLSETKPELLPLIRQQFSELTF